MRLHWHRRDLRTTDNRALASAVDGHRALPVFVVDPGVCAHASPIRVALLREALAALRERFRALGSDLLIARGEAATVLPRLAVALDADGVTWDEDYSRLANERDAAVEEALAARDVAAHPVTDHVLHAPGTITTNAGDHYSVFSYFWKKWRDRVAPDPAPEPAADAFFDPADAIDGPSIGDVDFVDARDGDGGEEPSAATFGVEPVKEADPDGDLAFETPPLDATPAAAAERLEAFLEGPAATYDERRDYPAERATSRLSHHLKFGTIGIRTVVQRVREAKAVADPDEESGIEAFERQLAWRDFYAQALAATPEMVSEPVADFERPIEWRNDPDEFVAWKRGETGYPIVDAGMRQLRSEAYVHNRVRMITASFLTKDLLVDWRRGYAWFKERLADHDTPNEVGGWQWAASTGLDAQPYFRVFNPASQCAQYDPDGTYVREHVPELRDASTAAIHDWPDLDPAERTAAAPDYPAPIVDHAERREAAIAAHERARGKR